MLVTNPRTCSNLLVRILNLDKQPHTKHGGYHFLDCFFVMMGKDAMTKPGSEWNEEQRNAIWEKFLESIEKLEKTTTPEPDDGTQVVFTKEHVETFTNPMTLVNYSLGIKDDTAEAMTWDVGTHSGKEPRSPLNQTIFPDSYLESWNPVFLVRHPIRAFESILRSFNDVLVKSEQMPFEPSEEAKLALISGHMTLSWTRRLWEFYESKGIVSLIVDADDLVTQPQAVTQKLADWVGIDKDTLQYTWSEVTGKELESKEHAMKRMLSSLHASAGVTVDPSKLAKNLGSPEEQLPKWKKEFGEEYGERMKGWVEGAMGDYEFLRERRMMP